jgi:hypothetical protein
VAWNKPTVARVFLVRGTPRSVVVEYDKYTITFSKEENGVRAVAREADGHRDSIEIPDYIYGPMARTAHAALSDRIKRARRRAAREARQLLFFPL